MKETYKNINYDKLWCPSGDPFVDAGGYALKFLSEQFPEKDILELIEFATNIYVDQWDSKINSFFLNSKITQTNDNPPRKQKEETIKFFNTIINENDSTLLGSCRILGIKSKLYPVGRDLSVLSGSGAFANFHHSFESGMMVSKEVIIRYHFLPLGCELLGSNLCVISSNNPQTAELYVSDCCARTLMNIGQNASKSILKNESHSPSTAIFRFIDKLLSRYTNYDVKECVSLYHFTNFAAKPSLNIYTLPFQAFYFYILSQRNEYKSQWNHFVSHYYKTSELKNIRFDDATAVYIGTEKKEEKMVEETQYKYWYNVIYENLLKGKAITKEIRTWSKDHPFNLQLFAHYLILIQNMKNETLKKLNEIADFILTNTPESEMEKVITRLNGINTAFLLRRFILKVVEKNYAIGNEEAIVTVEDYTDYLFPENRSWMETRDVLLIYIYQKLHEKNIRVEIAERDDDSDDNFVDDTEQL
jgi:CRISPR-associated protein Cst1